MEAAAASLTALLPRSALEALIPRIAEVIDDVLVAVQAEVPEYSLALTESPGLTIKLGIEHAVRDFFVRLDEPERPLDEEACDLYRRLGRAEMQAGRSLESIKAGFDVGARALWRRVAHLAEETGLPASGVAALAELVFTYAFQVAAEVAEGHARARFDVAGERERQRRRLAALLLDPEGSDPSSIERVAALAEWRVPATVAAIAAAPGTHRVVAPRLDADVLSGMDPDGSWLIIPDPDGPGRMSSLRRAVRGVPAAVGLAVTPADAWRSLRWARLVLALVEQGTLPDEAPTTLADHLATVLIQQDAALAQAFAASRLAALDDLPATDRDRLTETLFAWLQYQRHAPSVASALHVHPQTVRYRIAQLRELLGDALESPEGRFELALALRAVKRSPCASSSPARPTG